MSNDSRPLAGQVALVAGGTRGGGRGIPVRTDHSRPDEVSALVDRIASEQDGRLDILVNGVWGGDRLTDWEHPLWEQDLEAGLRLPARYRGKSAVIRLAVAQAAELKRHGVAAVAITPGFLRSEQMLETFGVTEASWRDGAAVDQDFAFSETPA